VLRTYETKTIIQVPLDKDSLVYIRHYPQMKDEILRVGRLLREFNEILSYTLHKNLRLGLCMYIHSQLWR